MASAICFGAKWGASSKSAMEDGIHLAQSPRITVGGRFVAGWRLVSAGWMPGRRSQGLRTRPPNLRGGVGGVIILR